LISLSSVTAKCLIVRNDPELIAKYIALHKKECHWKIVRDGIKAVGILEMEIYRFDNRLFMIIEKGLDFECEKAFSDLAHLPMQEEWQDTVSPLQDSLGGTLSDKWMPMERMFYLYEEDLS